MNKIDFEIILKSPTLLSNGEPEGLYDDSFIQDEFRLPVFPAKRLKGLLRESCTELLEWSGNPNTENIINFIFGKAGESNNTTGAHIQVYNAEIKNREEWLHLIDNNKGNEDILDAIDTFFSMKIAQTQIEADGIAKKGSLRQFKLLAPKEQTSFVGQILVPEDISEALIEFIKIGLKNVRRVGTGRNRGWGKVQIKTNENDSSNVIKSLKEFNIQSSKAVDKKSNSTNQGEVVKLHSKDYIKISLQIKAESNLIFPRWTGDENTVSTKDHIPGSMIWGALAGKYIRTIGKHQNNIMDDSNFLNLFYNGGLRFKPAFPLADNEVYKYPARHWVQSKLKPKDPYANMFDKIVRSGKPISTLAFISFADRKFRRYEVKKIQSFHNSRGIDAESRLSGTNGDSGIYYYESVGKDTSFYTEVKILPEFEELFRSLVKDKRLKVGKSKNNQFGEVSVEILENPLNQKTAVGSDACDLVFESPAILLGLNGFADLSVHNVARYLNISEEKIIRCNIRKETIQRFQGNLNVFLPAFEAITPGSSVRLQGLNNEDFKKLQALTDSGIGIETEKGFGQFRLDPIDENLKLTEDVEKEKGEKEGIDLSGETGKLVAFELAKKMAHQQGFDKAKGKDGEYKNGVYQAIEWLASCKGKINEEVWNQFKREASKKVKQKFIERHNLLGIFSITSQSEKEKKSETVIEGSIFSTTEIEQLQYIAALAYVERLKSLLN